MVFNMALSNKSENWIWILNTIDQSVDGKEIQQKQNEQV